MVRAIFGAAFLGLALLGPIFFAGPQLARDLSTGQQWRLADDLAIKEAKCTRWYFLVSTCRIEYVNRRETERLGGSLNYLIFGSWSGERARLLRSTSDPDRIGTTLGLDHMQGRVASLGVFLALALAILLGLALSLVRSPRPSPVVPSTSEFSAAPAGSTFGRRTGTV